MTAETLFSICNTIVLPQWLLLITAPNWKWTQRLVNSYFIPLILAAVYAYLLITHAAQTQNGGFGSLEQVHNLFSNHYLLLGGWVHYLAFDLLIGNWMTRNAQHAGITHWLVIPCLLFTFMLGPIGFLLYQFIKRIYPTKKLLPYETA